MKDKGNKKTDGRLNHKDLEERTFQFAVSVIKFLKKIPSSRENNVVKYQLAKSGTSIGANYEEAQGAFSKDDFRYKVGICFREAKESNYWLRIIKAADIAAGENLGELITESEELTKIFGSISKKISVRKDI